MFTTFSQWLDDRTGLVAVCKALCGWTVPSGTRACRLLPPMIAFAFCLQVLTGVFLWAFYSTSGASAWESIFYVQYLLPGGWLVRGIHHWSAQFLVLLLGIHFIVLVLSGRYRTPREFVFWGTVVLLLFSLASCLTGDLLTWTLNGYSATKVRVNFLQMLPLVGDALFKIVAGGPDFGTLTIPRFLVLHILVFGFGGFGAMVLWRWCENRAGMIEIKQAAEISEGIPTMEGAPLACRPVSFWSCPVVLCSVAALLFMVMTLLGVYHKPLLGTVPPASLPREAVLGAKLAAPADPPTFYDAARPEWSFRALYHFSNYFSGTQKFYAIFVIPTCLVVYLFLIPIIGRIRAGHFLNIVAAWVLSVSFAYLTFASYQHDYYGTDDSVVKFREDERSAAVAANRAIELCLAPTGIPPQGAASLLRQDPLVQGPVLFKQHCISCHPFQPLESKEAHPDFSPLQCDDRSAPNLYDPVSADWIAGWLDANRIKSDEYYGKTKFLGGAMAVTYLTGAFRDAKELMDEPEAQLKAMVALLHEEAKLSGPRSDGAKELGEEKLLLMEDFGCLDCHQFYNDATPTTQAPDLRGYMSRQWMIDFIANPTEQRFYGPDRGEKAGNDRMMAYHLSEKDCVMSMREIETLVDWLRGTWYRPEAGKTGGGGKEDGR